MNENNLNQAQLYALLQQAGKRLHMTPEALAQNFQQGGLDKVMEALPPDTRRQAAPFFADRARAEALLKSPQVQQLFEKLLERQE